MRDQRPGDALEAYRAAWPHTELNDLQRVWLLLSIANAAIRYGNHDEAFTALSAVHENFADTGIVVGNPLFHLLVGLAYHGLNENERAKTDNFARALICGGEEIFNGEEPVHLKQLKEVLRPPEELGTWTGYEGCSRDSLNGATGYLRDLLTEKIGTPPPYRYDD